MSVAQSVRDSLLYIVDTWLFFRLGGGPRVVVSTAASNAGVMGSFPDHGGLKERKNVSSTIIRKTQYCREPP